MKTISSSNIGPVLFLEELRTQYLIAKAAFDHLKKAADAWLHAEPLQWTPPRDIAIHCGAFLSAAGIISKIIFEGNRKGIISRRCQSLRQLLDLEDSPHLRNLAVRNSFEHIDERIDEQFSFFDEETFRVELLSVAPEPPKSGTIVFKRFDPIKLSLSSGGDEILLREFMSEISTIESKTHSAIRKLEGNVVHLWNP